MINSAENFIKLRISDNLEEQHRASFDEADEAVWLEIIHKYPEYKEWVIHNKTVPIQILEILAQDEDASVREAVARKRKINDYIFNILSTDKEEQVRYALISNTKLSKEKKIRIQTNDSPWLAKALKEQLSKDDL